MSPGPRALRWLTTLLARVLPADRRAEVLGDLEEAYRERTLRQGPWQAGIWWLIEVLAYLIRLPWEGLRTRRAGITQTSRGGSMERVARDVRFAARALRRSPAFAGAAIATLALGIGAGTAVFSVVHQAVLQPLPFPDPDRLVVIRSTFQGQSWWSTSPVEVTAWRERVRTLSGLAYADRRGMSFASSGEPEQITGVRVSADLLDVLQVEPSRGRAFGPEDGRLDAARVTILTHGFWRDRMGADPAVVGRQVRLDGVEHTVVGVLPPGMEPSFLGHHEVLVPRIFDEGEVQQQGRTLSSVARLADGISIEAAQADMERVSRSVEEDGTLAPGWGVRVVPLLDQVVGDASRGLAVLSLAVLLVLAVACANVTHLLIARAADRESEAAVRRALGASRLSIARLHLAEAGLLSLAGSALGVLLAVLGGNALLRIHAGSLPRVTEIGLDGPMIAAALALSLVTALVSAAAPALLSWTAGRSAWPGFARAPRTGPSGRTHGVLVSAQLGLLVVLLSGTALALERFHALTTTDPGFEMEDRVAVGITLPPTRYATPVAIADFFTELVQAVEALPEVRAAGAISNLPLTGPGFTGFHLIDGRPLPPPGEEPLGGMEAIDGEYFRSMGIPLLAGRGFTSLDAAQAPPVAIVDRAMVLRNWPDGSSPLGERVSLGPPGPGFRPLEIVGVVPSVRYGLDAEPRPRVYVPGRQLPFATPARELVVWTQPGIGTGVVPRIRDLVRKQDPDQPLGDIRPLEAVAVMSLSETRLRAVLLAVFAAVAMTLATVGVYGLVRYSVSRRHRELGVRLAIGCRSDRLVRWIVGRALIPVGVGLVLGLVVSIWTNRLLASVLLGPSQLGATAGLGVGAILAAVAWLAAWLPARRARRLDIARTLRID